jgi:hypothetical protein
MEPDRISVYDDMDEMFQYTLASSGLEAYIEDAIQPDMTTNRVFRVSSPNKEVEAALNALFENLEIEDRIAADMWTLGKYGDEFSVLRYNTNIGIFDAIPLEPRIVWRHEDSHRVLKGFSVGESEQMQTEQDKQPTYKPWDMIHWRMRGRRVTDLYGTPLFMNIRQTYKMLKLMEEQMTIYRMKMHPDRLLFKIYTGASTPMERMRAVRQWRREMEKITSVNQDQEKMISEHGPWAATDDIYWPIGEGDMSSDVTKFPGSGNSMAIFDVEYMRDLFFAGMRVPKGYMGFEDSQGYRGDATLSQQSIKFARGVKNFQRNSIRGWVQMAKIHLAILGIDSDDPKNAFTLSLAPVAFLEEAQKSEQAMTRFQTVDYLLQIGDRLAMNGLNPTTWVPYVLIEYGGFTEEDVANFFIEGVPMPVPLPDPEEITEDGHEQVQEAIQGDSKLADAIATFSAKKQVEDAAIGNTIRSSSVNTKYLKGRTWGESNDGVPKRLRKPPAESPLRSGPSSVETLLRLSNASKAKESKWRSDPTRLVGITLLQLVRR